MKEAEDRGKNLIASVGEVGTILGLGLKFWTANPNDFPENDLSRLDWLYSGLDTLVPPM